MSSPYSSGGTVQASPQQQEFDAAESFNRTEDKPVKSALDGGGAPPSVASPSFVGVVASRTQIHADGQFYAIRPEEYLRNLSAIKSLLNEKNDLQNKLNEAVDPVYVRISSVIAAVVNLVAVIIVGIGVNLVTSEKPPAWAVIILIAGIVLTLVATVFPLLVAFFPQIFKKPSGNK